jgi:GAF domain-containing protein
MSGGLAPRPANEERRAQAVLKTGLIDAPNPEIFQVYCDLAKDITGFEEAYFSLYDGEMSCGIAAAGSEEFEVGEKGLRHENSICSYVLLDTEPLIMEDISKDPIWKTHPKILDGTGILGYAGFPVINKDNYALGTLCMMNSDPKALSEHQIELIKKITANIALLLDSQIDQKELTSQKILEALGVFQKGNRELDLDDFKLFLSMSADLPVDRVSSGNLIQNGLCEISETEKVILSSMGRQLLMEMKLESKPMKKVKIKGDAAEDLIDEMFASLN